MVLDRLEHASTYAGQIGEYDAGRDLLAAEGSGGFVTLDAGSFAILWPQDAQRPGISVQGPWRVRKVVLKVRQ
jgi:YhcH/YjgK/YiaL family protein